MAQVTQQQCDACGGLLTGKRGVEQVYKEFLSIKGQIGMAVVDKETKWRDFLYLTPKMFDGEKIDLSFCNLECFKDYLDQRLVVAKAKLEKRLREEAAGEYQERSEIGYNLARSGSSVVKKFGYQR